MCFCHLVIYTYIIFIFNSANFYLMLFITFFCEPVVVKLDAEGYAVAGPKPEHMRVELGEELREYEVSREE